MEDFYPYFLTFTDLKLTLEEKLKFEEMIMLFKEKYWFK